MCEGFVNSARRAVQTGNRTNTNMQSPHNVLILTSSETHFCKCVGVPISYTSVQDNLGLPLHWSLMVRMGRRVVAPKSANRGDEITLTFQKTNANSESNSHPRSNPALLLPPHLPLPRPLWYLWWAEQRKDVLGSPKLVTPAPSFGFPYLSKHWGNGTANVGRRPNDSGAAHTRAEKEAKHEKKAIV